MTRDQRKQLISRLNGRTQTKAFEAAKAVWMDSDHLLEVPLLRTLKNGSRPLNRAAAAFALQMLKTSRTIRALEHVVQDISEHPRVRGEAAEALAHGHRKRSHEVLLTALDDHSKDVRFWCAFSLGEMAEKRAIPALKLLIAGDKRIVRGFHSVAKEAAEALKNIESEKKRHRSKNGCIFCRRA